MRDQQRRQCTKLWQIKVAHPLNRIRCIHKCLSCKQVRYQVWGMLATIVSVQMLRNWVMQLSKCQNFASLQLVWCKLFHYWQYMGWDCSLRTKICDPACTYLFLIQAIHRYIAEFEIWLHPLDSCCHRMLGQVRGVGHSWVPKSLFGLGLDRDWFDAEIICQFLRHLRYSKSAKSRSRRRQQSKTSSGNET